MQCKAKAIILQIIISNKKIFFNGGNVNTNVYPSTSVFINIPVLSLFGILLNNLKFKFYLNMAGYNENKPKLIIFLSMAIFVYYIQ